MKKKQRKNQIKLDPMCFRDFPFAVTNQGYLLPCCYCEDPKTMNDPDFIKLLSVSKLSENSSIEEILQKKEWVEFEKNLHNNIGPHACINTCRVRENKNDIVRKDTHIDPEKKDVIKVRNV